MSAAIVCVGKLRERFYQDAAAEYQKRLSRYDRVDIIELSDLPEPQNASDAQRQKLIDQEGQGILSRLKPTDYVVAMVIAAPQLESPALAGLVRDVRSTGKRLTFVIGGSLGLSDAVLRRADMHLSMSKMTFPHQLARIMLLEQLYRAHKINAGEKYHK